ncbi:MAG: WG repeat-containing protein [Planctomycetota bacterium]
MNLQSIKSDILRHLLLALALLGIFHFTVSLLAWSILGLWIPLVYWQDTPMDWGMFMHAIPIVVLFCVSISAIALARKRKLQKAAIKLGFVLIASVSWFFFETGNDLYQFSSPAHHIGNVYSILTIGERHMYFNWPWYEEVIPYSSMSNKYNYKYGYINKQEQIVIKQQFDYAQRFSEGLAAVCINDRWGYIDKTGHVVIKVQFDHAKPFSQGMAAVEIGDKWGYINASGQFVIEARFDYVRAFREGLAEVKIGDKHEHIDKTGQVVKRTQDEHKPKFSEGLAKVVIGEKWAYMDESGQIVIDPNFNEAGPFHRGLARVKVGDKWGLINKTGKYILKPEFDTVYHHSAGPAFIMNDNGKWGYRRGYIIAVYNETAKVLVWLPFDKVPQPFSEGLAAIFVEDKWSFGHDGKWGYIDESGKMAIVPQFDYADRFYEGLARIGISVDK